MKRREFLMNQGVLVAALLAPAACARPKTRSEVLSALVREVVVPEVRAARGASQKLAERAGALSRAPTIEAFRQSREACRDALLAWKRAHTFRIGPLVETNALLRATFWPARPATIESTLGKGAAIGDGLVESLGSDAKGLYAVEYLLFPLDQDEQGAFEALDGPAGERRRQFLDALAKNVVAHAEKAHGALGDGAEFARRFASDEQASVSQLVNQMVTTVETLAFNRLALVLGLAKSRLLKPAEVEGWPSGSSQRLALAELGGIEDLYGSPKQGRVSDLVLAIAPAVDQRVHERLAAAVAAVKKLDGPLEQVVKTNAPLLDAALAATKALEIALKVDVASALGVTMTFQAGDGD